MMRPQNLKLLRILFENGDTESISGVAHLLIERGDLIVSGPGLLRVYSNRHIRRIFVGRL